MKTVRLIGVMLLVLFCVAVAGAEENYKVVTSEQLKAMIDAKTPGLVLIDARNPEEYQEVHIKDALNIPLPKLEKDRLLLKAPKDARLVFYCNGVKCGKSPKAAKIALEMGYRDVAVYSEGMPVWEEKGYALYVGPDYEKKVETTKVAPRELKALLDSKPGMITLVDVRDPNEFVEGHLPGAINIPATSFAASSGVLDKGKRIIVYCNSGARSYNAYRKLQKLAYPNIGQAIFADWKAAGLPVAK
jgi:rhodanese-related sulfurtransferase